MTRPNAIHAQRKISTLKASEAYRKIKTDMRVIQSEINKLRKDLIVSKTYI